MCIIVYKPEGVSFPAKSVLKTCFNCNPDGGGYMFAADGKVHIIKGLMSFNMFYKSLQKTRAAYGENIPYVLHFRISTQAGQRPDCTHPFPLSANMDDLRKLNNQCNIGIAHNGIISLTSSGYSRIVTYNDTMKFITDYLTLIINDKQYYRNKNTLLLIERLADSRLAILDDSGHCEIIGEGWIKDNGIYYSNQSYKTIAPSKKSKKSSSVFDDDFFSNYCHDDIDDFTRQVNDAWNDDEQLYDFNPLDCPNMIYFDDSFCEVCKNYYSCYGLTNKGGKH